VDYAIPVYRVSLVREGGISCDAYKFRNSATVSKLLHTYLADADREHFVIFFVDQKNQVIGVHTVSIGSLTASLVHPREVFKAAILANAAAIVCGHNHPSGDVQPSREDRATTKRLVDAGKLLGIEVLDHIIIGREGVYFSFADENILS
jgi:DNA repair protein RadC